MKVKYCLIKCWSTAAVLAILLQFGAASLAFKGRPGITTKPVFIVIHPLDDDRIVGGYEAEEGQFPFQASIQTKFSSTSSHYCGGSYISPNYVVTAAHCVRGRNETNILVKGGSITFDDAVASNVTKIIIHPQYDSNSVRNDIALLKLETPVNSSKVESISLPNPFQETPESASCVVSGWGTTSEGGTLPDTLRFVGVDILGDRKCREQYGDEKIDDTMICAGVEGGEKDSCQGDSGGPLTCDGKLVGIVSWGYGCARPNFAGVYTQVSHFVDSFLKIIKN